MFASFIHSCLNALPFPQVRGHLDSRLVTDFAHALCIMANLLVSRRILASSNTHALLVQHEFGYKVGQAFLISLAVVQSLEQVNAAKAEVEATIQAELKLQQDLKVFISASSWIVVVIDPGTADKEQDKEPNREQDDEADFSIYDSSDYLWNIFK